jgi:hypothetical protein
MDPASRPHCRGYLIIMLMMAVFVITIGLLVATPVWQTEIQREKEEELIFRGRQYAEAVRLYLLKNPNQYPSVSRGPPGQEVHPPALQRPLGPERGMGRHPGDGPAGGRGRPRERSRGPRRPPEGPALHQVRPYPGVVSSSRKRSIKIYNDQESHDKWLFFYGQDPKKLPRIIYHGEQD